jgi:8-oxo-dGTP pyrophosphatase MutT (NUDIX family)
MVQAMPMSVKVESSRGSRLGKHRLGTRGAVPLVRFPELKKLQECEQAAAVCYRLKARGGIEFLLVRTRGSRRWTFPKGSAEPGLTHAQVAALEAFEEAGVHGRIEKTAFAHYAGRKRGGSKQFSAKSAETRLKVSAYLCEVLGLTRPKERNRNRTWFSAPEAKQKLREGRTSGSGAQFSRVVDEAVARLEKLHGEADVCGGVWPGKHAPQNLARPDDDWQRVSLEAEIPIGDRKFMGWRSIGEPATLSRRPLLGLAQSRRLLQLNSPQLTLAPAPGQKPHEAKKTRASG